MKRVAALLAAVLAARRLAACGGGGAEPGASERGDPRPRLPAQRRPRRASTRRSQQGYYRDAGVDLDVREPSASTDAPKLLEAGRAQFAILDIHDLGDRPRARPRPGRRRCRSSSGRWRGDRRATATRSARPRDLEGGTVGRHRPALRRRGARLGARRPAAPTRRGRPGDDRLRRRRGARRRARSTRRPRSGTPRAWRCSARACRRASFRVDDYGAPRYPELVLVTTRESCSTTTASWSATVVERHRARLRLGVERPASRPSTTCSRAPIRASTAPSRPPSCERCVARTRSAIPGSRSTRPMLTSWARWEAQHGIVERPLERRRGTFAELVERPAERLEQPLDELRHLPRHPRPRHHQVDPGRLGAPRASRRSVCAVEAEHRQARARRPPRGRPRSRSATIRSASADRASAPRPAPA